jgi:hypothetical protein
LHPFKKTNPNLKKNYSFTSLMQPANGLLQRIQKKQATKETTILFFFNKGKKQKNICPLKGTDVLFFFEGVPRVHITNKLQAKDLHTRSTHWNDPETQVSSEHCTKTPRKKTKK